MKQETKKNLFSSIDPATIGELFKELLAAKKLSWRGSLKEFAYLCALINYEQSKEGENISLYNYIDALDPKNAATGNLNNRILIYDEITKLHRGGDLPKNFNIVSLKKGADILDKIRELLNKENEDETGDESESNSDQPGGE